MIYMSEDHQPTATYCPDCEAYFDENEEGFEWEECIECGSPNVFEVNA